MDKYCCMIYTEKGAMFSVENVNLHLIYFNYFNSINELFDTFDFTVCMGAFDFLTEKFVLHDRFLEHNADRCRCKANCTSCFTRRQMYQIL